MRILISGAALLALLALDLGAAVYRGEKIAFCCPPCKAKFEQDPESWMAKMRAEPAVHGYLPVRR